MSCLWYNVFAVPSFGVSLPGVSGVLVLITGMSVLARSTASYVMHTEQARSFTYFLLLMCLFSGI